MTPNWQKDDEMGSGLEFADDTEYLNTLYEPNANRLSCQLEPPLFLFRNTAYEHLTRCTGGRSCASTPAI